MAARFDWSTWQAAIGTALKVSQHSGESQGDSHGESSPRVTI